MSKQNAPQVRIPFRRVAAPPVVPACLPGYASCHAADRPRLAYTRRRPHANQESCCTTPPFPGIPVHAVSMRRCANGVPCNCMPLSRSILAWLCGVLMLISGMPLGAQVACEHDAPAVHGGVVAGCCDVRCCCCQRSGDQKTCHCDKGEHPAPQPAAPAPHQEQATEPKSTWRPLPPATLPACEPQILEDAGLPIGLLPQLSRQKALSVWLC